jgi:mono/diheme cytochrome c family protein
MERKRNWVLVALLGSLVGCAPASPPRGGAASAAPGTVDAASKSRTVADLFDANCSPCHQEAGEGVPGVYPSLAGSPTVLGDAGALARWLLKGQRAATMAPPGHYATAMPKFGWLNDADAAALLTYLRSSFGNRAPPVDAATVASALKD